MFCIATNRCKKGRRISPTPSLLSGFICSYLRYFLMCCFLLHLIHTSCLKCICIILILLWLSDHWCIYNLCFYSLSFYTLRLISKSTKCIGCCLSRFTKSFCKKCCLCYILIRGLDCTSYILPDIKKYVLLPIYGLCR